MKTPVSLHKRVLQALTVVPLIVIALSGCGGGGGSDGAPALSVARVAAPAGSVNPGIVPLNAQFRGKTYGQWEASFWQWALALPVSPLPHPFNDCQNRPISAGQTGNVWYWSAPDRAPLTCDQSKTVIPVGTAIFLSMLDVEASSLDAPPFFATSASDQQQITTTFAGYISDLFCSIDGVMVNDLTAYRAKTGPFPFSAPTPWVFNQSGGSGTAAADGYFLMLKPLPPGPHKIHYGGTFHIPDVDVPKDVTLLITVGEN